MDKDALLKLVIEASGERDGKTTLTCARAHGLAKKHKVTLKASGEVCDANGVRIVECQMGCFK